MRQRELTAPFLRSDGVVRLPPFVEIVGIVYMKDLVVADVYTMAYWRKMREDFLLILAAVGRIDLNKYWLGRLKRQMTMLLIDRW